MSVVIAEPGNHGGLPLRVERVAAVDEAEGAGVAVEEGGAAYGADFSVAEESAEGDGGDYFTEDFGVVVGASEEVLTPADAGEH